MKIAELEHLKRRHHDGRIDGKRGGTVSGSETVLGKGAQKIVWGADRGTEVDEQQCINFRHIIY